MSNDTHDNTTAAALWEYEGRRMEAQDYDEEVKACRAYILNTPARDQSFEGWREYWELRRSVPGYPCYHVEEEFFNELRRRLLGRKFVTRETTRQRKADYKKAEINQARADFLNALKESAWLRECPLVEGTEPPFIWKGTQVRLARELLRAELVPDIPNRWEAAARVFSWHGSLLTGEQLKDAAKKAYMD